LVTPLASGDGLKVKNSLFSVKRGSRLKNADFEITRNDGCSYITGYASTPLTGWRKPPECQRSRNSRLHNPHGTAAARAVDLGTFCQPYQGFNRVQLEQLLE
jgi:hypothetical protein